MSQSIRFIKRGVKGRIPENFNWGSILSASSVVHITASEIVPQLGITPPLLPPGVPPQNFIFHVGDANVWVSNISPHNDSHFQGEPGGVEFVLNVDARDPIDVAVTITVEDNFPIENDAL